uniref:NADH:ubiquinone reductase (H(+)-translocating) n=1 Tax=Cyanea nozakii TaxID=135523 RepID=A0A343VTM5_CYANO|nr:NADH dehydrogenase subunit 2 [Cyanea nozakii]
MNYFYLEILLFILLLISLLFHMNPNMISVFIFVLSLILIKYYNILEVYNSWEIVTKGFCVVIGLVILTNFEKKELESLSVLIISIILATTMMISCVNTLSIYVCLELQSLSLFVLLSRKRNAVKSIEAALKYFVLSSLSSGIYLLGSALLFLSSGTCDIQILSDSCMTIEKTLIICALLFKLACAPFHVWAPEVYYGCDAKSLITIGTLPKIGVISVLIHMTPNASFILVVAILSLVIGSVGALNHTKINKILAYSGILNMGFILIGIAGNSHNSLESCVIYLTYYIISFLLILMLINNFSINSLDKLVAFSTKNVTISITFGFLVLSIAGIPPFGGFFAKWLILNSAVNLDLIVTVIVAVFCTVIAGVYYLRMIKISNFQEDRSYLTWKKILLKENMRYKSNNITSSVLFFLIFFIIFCPHLIKEIAHISIISIS